ncbi:hypothetical protein O6H91_09G025700 [Diphasiastrum complanatum]|nr:hypothetical protein O6H91_09G025700 [Diphasiastrum complanatum]
MSEAVHGSCTLLLQQQRTFSNPHIGYAHQTCCMPKKDLKASKTVLQLIVDKASPLRIRTEQFPKYSSTLLRAFAERDVKPLPWRPHVQLPGQGFKKLKAAEPVSISVTEGNEDGACLPVIEQKSAENDDYRALLNGWKPPRSLWRSISVVIITGQVILRILKGRVHVRNTLQQLAEVGPRSLGVNLLTASFVGMVFTIQFVREFAKLGLTRSVGGVLALALARELSPVVTAVILAGRVGSAFAAELGTMQVSEQTDTLRVLKTDPVDYLVTPRVIACAIAMPFLTLMAFTVGMGASVLLADSVYGISANIILDSASKALEPWDIISSMIKSVVFGGIISIVSCAWGVTTLGGAKGVGESTTSAVVISLIGIFIADFVLSWCFFQGAGDALKAAMG